MKLKRELGAIDASDVPIDQPRTKRRKRGSSVASPSVNDDTEMADESISDAAGEGKENEAVKDMGLRIWLAVRNAKAKELVRVAQLLAQGLIITHVFPATVSSRMISCDCLRNVNMPIITT